VTASFVIDEQLSPLLARRLIESGYEAVHIREVGLGSASDSRFRVVDASS
jgi:predicted nuclease of predicted toxin-antitoxin system